MDYAAEAQIARELMKFAANGLLYRGSKPVMWSVVEKTALAEAEVEYEDYTSDQVWVKFPIGASKSAPGSHHKNLLGASVVIWTTTPWTIPGNRAVSYSSRIKYGVFEVTEAPDQNWARKGDRLILADDLAPEVLKTAKVEGYLREQDVDPHNLMYCFHPLRGKGYEFFVPLLAGEHVTADTGTGFVHTAPGHGREDFDI